MAGVGANARLTAGEGARRTPFAGEAHAEQRDAHLLTGGEQHIQFTPGRAVTHLTRQLQQAIGLSTHGGQHHDHIVAHVTGCLYPVRDALDALQIAHRGAAVFLDDQRHDIARTPAAQPPRRSRIQLGTALMACSRRLGSLPPA